MGSICCPEASISNYQHTPHGTQEGLNNIAAEARSHILTFVYVGRNLVCVTFRVTRVKTYVTTVGTACVCDIERFFFYIPC